MQTDIMTYTFIDYGVRLMETVRIDLRRRESAVSDHAVTVGIVSHHGVTMSKED